MLAGRTLLRIRPLERCKVLAFALSGALDGGFYQHIALRATPGCLGSVNSSSSMGAVFDDERDADAIRWAAGRNQDFAASKLGGEISHSATSNAT
jgi:hypothetical protein